MPVAQHLLVSLDHMLLRKALANASSAVRENDARAAARAAASRALGVDPQVAGVPSGRAAGFGR